MAALESADPRARCFVGLCLYCGLRREEALGLQWSGIQGERLTVNRTMTFVGNQRDTSQELKNSTSHRTVPIPKFLQAILKVTPQAGMYVITCVTGSSMTKSGFRRMWNTVKREAPCEVDRIYKPFTRKRKIPRNHMIPGNLTGDPSGIRTPDTLIKSQVLCQLS